MDSEKTNTTHPPLIEHLWNSLQDSARIKKWLLRLPALLTVIFVLLSTHTAAVLTWKLMPRPEFPRPAAARTTKPVADPAPHPRYDARQIASWSLMGTKPVPAVSKKIPAAVVNTLKETSLQINLIGIVYSKHSHESRAIILGGPKDPKERNLYKVGDKVSSNASIETILPDRIILLHNNERVSLKLKSVKDMEQLLKKYSNKNNKLKK